MIVFLVDKTITIIVFFLKETIIVFGVIKKFKFKLYFFVVLLVLLK